MTNRHPLLVTLFALILAGCGKGGSPMIESADDLTQYDTLPGITASHLKPLRDELASLESEHATAAQLTRKAFTIPTSVGPTSAEDVVTTAAELRTVFTPEVQASLSKQLDQLYPVGPFTFSDSALQAAVQLKDRYDVQRQRIHQLIAQQEHGFEIQFTQGLAADMSFVDIATIANRLAAIVAAERLFRDDPPGAIVVLREMMGTINAIAEEKHVIPRIAAVHRRGEALRVLEAIANHPRATLEIHQQLARLIDDQLAAWPADASAWIGDRAIGLQMYELVRDGYLLSLLSVEEQGRLRREVGFDRLAKQVAENLDEDELFYAQAMRRAIGACERPYFQRLRIFRDIDDELASRRDTLIYPLVADLILWRDVQEGQRLQALDRARCEAWSLALAESTAAPRPTHLINPLSGTRYILDPRADTVIVDGIDPDQGGSPIVIPRKASPR